jgi:multidrug resistance efflux pump
MGFANKRERRVNAAEGRSAPKPRLAEETSGEGLRQRVESLRLPPAVTVRGSAGSKLAWTLCLLLAASTGWLGYVVVEQQKKLAAGQPAAKAAPVKAVSRAAAAASSGEIVLESKGHIIPAHQILVSPKVSGMVVKLLITESQRVGRGDVLAELEDTEYRADRDRAAATVETAKQNLAELQRGFRPEEIEQTRAELAESQAQLVQLEADYRRAAQLYSKRVISKEEYDAALSKYEAMQRHVQRLELAVKLAVEGPRAERIAAARSQVTEAEAELAKAQWRLSNCIIRAPVSGTILKKNAEEGSLVNPVAMQGFYSLCEMADLSDLEVELMIPEREVSKIFKNQRCKVRAEAFPDRVYEGYISRQMPTADRSKAAIPVRVKLRVPADEEGVYLKPDMGAIVAFMKP